MAIRKYSNELSRTSTSRLTEEVNKILSSGHSREIFNDLQKYKLLVFMLPCFSIYCKFPQVQDSLKSLDERVMLAKENKGPPVMLADMIKALVDPLIVFADDQLTIDERFKETFRQIKVLISPMTPSNYEVELASERLLSERGFKTPRNCVRNQRPVNKPPQRRGPSRPKRSEGSGEISVATKKRRSRGRGPNRGGKSPVELGEKATTSAEVHDL
ncbi:MAG TPA: poly(A) polymerase, partial [Sphaerochaeta sp.]|nr:poly(A) polymerase [Sphaerochaeta sp.]